ncbi:hypothetical protein C5167_035395 [Papaver somniferum]|uniref:Uncharacterized protein n=1 Tax=Papaver somniferum TaxID=3469 RepID=A0A4Y7KFT5_PAPSO|nr:uncharacterized protein LOC113300262 [Papaver somniferum]RZC72233.1 hypothetical protein C5167_035395 [Papaver somniferum]
MGMNQMDREWNQRSRMGVEFEMGLLVWSLNLIMFVGRENDIVLKGFLTGLCCCEIKRGAVGFELRLQEARGSEDLIEVLQRNGSNAAKKCSWSSRLQSRMDSWS